MQAYSLFKSGLASLPSLHLQSWRARLLFMLLALCAGILFARALYLVTFKEAFLREQGEARFVRRLTLVAHRGNITDRNGQLLAESTPVRSIWASPANMKPLSPRELHALAELLGLSFTEVSQKLAETRREFVYLRRQLPPKEADRVLALDIPGIFAQTEYRRYYPAREEFAQLVGFTDIDNRGQEGLELAYDGLLAGEAGSRQVIRDRRGYIVEDLTNIERPIDGQPLTLSIDARLQHIAYRELAAAVEDNRAQSGSIVVLDARSGEVLALASYPSFNPNTRSSTLAVRRNRALIDTYEPGSTMKPFTIAAALESGKVNAHTQVQTGKGVYQVGIAEIHDTSPHGLLNVGQIIQKSSNIGAAKLQLSMGREYLWTMYDKLGFGKIPQLNFPGEASGKLRTWKTWQPIEQATMAYGHGIAVTLMQIAHAYQIFALDGEQSPLSFQKISTPLPRRQQIRLESARAVRRMLQLVTEPGGTAPRAHVPGYSVGGKSGTSRKLDSSGVYSFEKYVGSFVGIAPISAPRLIVAVMIDTPSAGRYYGGEIAAPVFSRVVASSLPLLNVPFDLPLSTTAPESSEARVREEM